MNDETKKEIQLALSLLRNTLIKNGVSMGLEFKNKEIMFFDTKTYLNARKLNGFSVNTDDLVK